MTSHIVRALLRLYPAEWRAEFGEELCTLLSLRPITTHIFADVLFHALRERLRREAWTLCAAALLILTSLGIYVNNTAPLSDAAYRGYQFLWQGIVLLAGCLSVLQSDRSSPSWTAAKTALIGLIPELIAMTLWVFGLFHPLLRNAAGPIPLSESRLALFSMTFATAPHPGVISIALLAAVVSLGAGVIGFFGGLLGRATTFLWRRLHHAA